MEASKKKQQCWECRRRRLVCDFTHPECRKCRLRGVSCPGYDSRKPLKWLQPQQVNSKGPEKMVVPRPVKSAAEHDMGAILQAIEYYNVHIAPDLTASGASGPQTTYFVPLKFAPYLSRPLTHSFICTSLCHRILQSSDQAPSDQLVLARRLQRHRGDALRALAADLGKTGQQPSDETLASVLALLLVELQQSFDPPDWRYHCNGAAALMETMGGFGNLVFSRPYLRHLLRFHALIEVMGNTTSAQVEIGSAQSQLELISLLPVLYGNGLATPFPCPPDLLAEIIRINHLRSIFQGAVSMLPGTDHTLAADKHLAALDVLRRIRAFPTDKWAAEVAFGSPPEDAAAQVGFSGWQAIACIYQSAAAIYCIASVLQHDDTESTAGTGCRPDDGAAEIPHTNLPTREAVATARKTCASILLSRLREVSKCPRLRKLVIWPLFVAGVQAEDEATKRFIVGELRWISNALGTAAPLVAKDLLENRVWRFGISRGGWDDMFDRSYVFVL